MEQLNAKREKGVPFYRDEGLAYDMLCALIEELQNYMLLMLTSMCIDKVSDEIFMSIVLF